MTKPRKHLQIRDLVFLQDTREQTPFDFGLLTPPGQQPLFRVEKATLDTGDYSIRDLTSEVVIERKNVEDLVACCYGENRTRFEKELQRMRAIPCRLVAVEADWKDVVAGFNPQTRLPWRSKIDPSSVTGSIMRWMGWGIPFHFEADKTEMVRFCANFAYLHAKACFDRLKSFDESLRIGG